MKNKPIGNTILVLVVHILATCQVIAGADFKEVKNTEEIMPSGNKRISIDFESSKEVVRQRLRYDKNGFLQILSFTISQGRTDIFSLILNGDEIAQRFENNNESAVITSSVQRDFSAIDITGSDKEGNAVFSFRRKKGENYFKPLDVDQMKELNDQLNRQRREIEAIIPTVP